MHLLKQGDHILSCSETYGGTRSIFLTQAKMQGIEVDFVDSTNAELFASAIKVNTRVMFLILFFLFRRGGEMPVHRLKFTAYFDLSVYFLLHFS